MGLIDILLLGMHDLNRGMWLKKVKRVEHNNYSSEKPIFFIKNVYYPWQVTDQTVDQK